MNKLQHSIKGLLGGIAMASSLLYVSGSFAAPATNPWLVCGSLSQIQVGGVNSGAIPGKPLTKFEYAIAYNSSEPIPVIVTGWNHGLRVYNKTPYLVFSDDPANMKQGGFIFYSGTLAADDNCGGGNFRHNYWYVGADNGVVSNSGNGCHGIGNVNPPIYCRLR